MLFVLDASAIVNDPNFCFEQNHSFITTPEVIAEFKTIETRALVDNALHHSLLEIRSPSIDSVQIALEKIRELNFERLSKADVSIIALALELKRDGKRFIVLTDDFSIQNFLALFKIHYSSVLQDGIKNIIAFECVCQGCGKKFSVEEKKKRCPDCGARIIKKKISKAAK